jgi:hypothetical protein
VLGVAVLGTAVLHRKLTHSARPRLLEHPKAAVHVAMAKAR